MKAALLVLALALATPAAASPDERVVVGPAQLGVPAGLERRAVSFGDRGDQIILSAGDEVLVVTAYRGRAETPAPSADAARRAHVDALVKAIEAQATPVAVRPLKLFGRARATTSLAAKGRTGFVVTATESGQTVVATALLREGSTWTAAFEGIVASIELAKGR